MAFDQSTHAQVPGVTVQFRSGDVTTSISTPTTSVELPAGTVTAEVLAWPAEYSNAWIDPTTASLPAGGSAAFVVTLNREGKVGAVSITKRDRVTGEPLAGASDRITAAHSNYSVILVTGPSGTGSVQLAPGGYNIEEIAAPTGYELDSTVRFVDVTSSQTRYLELFDTPIHPPVVVRSPGHRVPLTSIPTGRIY